MKTLPDKDLFTPDEVASYFSVSRRTIYLWIDHGLLNAEKFRRVIRISKKAIKECRIAAKLSPLE